MIFCDSTFDLVCGPSQTIQGSLGVHVNMFNFGDFDLHLSATWSKMMWNVRKPDQNLTKKLEILMYILIYIITYI